METSKRTYEKTHGSANTWGQSYETKMAALLFLRGINSSLEFELASNVKAARPLDDLVFRFKEADKQTWSTVFVQLKHTKKELSSITLQGEESIFWLKIYSNSFDKINKLLSAPKKKVLFDGSISDCLYVLFTNAKGNGNENSQINLGGREEAEGPAEKFLWTGHGTIASFDPDSGSSLDREVVGCLAPIGDSQRDFFRKFRIFADQPSHEDLDALIKCELGKSKTLSHLKPVDIDRLCEVFITNMVKWCEESTSLLDKDSDVLDRARIAVESRRAQDNLLKISFNEVALEPLQALLNEDKPENVEAVFIKSSESSSRISCSKLMQGMKVSYLFLSIETLLENVKAVMSLCQNENKKWLIFSSKECKEEGAIEKYLAALKEVQNTLQQPKTQKALQQPKTKKTRIAVVLWNDTFFGKLVTEFKTCTVYKDSFKYFQLDKSLQDSILNRQILFQGYAITLNDLFKDHRDSALSYINASAVVEILAKGDEPLTVGPNLPDEIDYYVPRKLDRASVNKSIFSESKLAESITIKYSTENDIQSILLNADPTLFPEHVKEDFDTFRKSLSDSVVFDGSVGVGLSWQLGMFDCNFLFLRNDEDVCVTALRFRRRPESPNVEASNAWFLFVPHDINAVHLGVLETFHQSKHLLRCKDGNIFWIQSSGDINIIRQHIDQDHELPRHALDFDFKEERVVLLCAEPGMGKTTLTKRMARHTKENFPNFWVCCIVLHDHDRLYGEGKYTNVFDFVSEATNIKSDLEMALLKVALEIGGNVLVILDGCDEISPKYAKECLALLLNISKTKTNKILITSRNSMKGSLEVHTSTLAVSVQNFSEDDKRTFLKQFWKSKSTLSESQLDDFIGLVLQKMSQAISNKEKDFLSIPLQMQIMATVYEPHNSQSPESILPEKLDLLDILEKFVKKKFKVYLEDKLKICIYDSNYDVHFEAHKMKRHAEAALLLFLSGDELKQLLAENKIKLARTFLEEIDSCKDNTGIIDSVVDGKPRFIHRVFAEYFVAVWFAEHFAKIPDKFLAQRMYSPEYSVVRDIFDRILARDHKLHTAVLNKDFESVRTLVKNNEDVNARDLGGRTALHLASAYSPKRDTAESVQRQEILDLLIKRTTNFDELDDLHKVPPIKYADFTQSWTALDRLIKLSSGAEKYLDITLSKIGNSEMLEYISIHNLENLVEFCHNKGVTVDRMYFGLPSVILPTVIRYASPEVISKAIGLYPSENDPLHYASANNDLDGVKRAMELHTESGNMSLKEYIDKKDDNGIAALHFAILHGHVEVVTCLFNHGANPKNHEERFGSTPLQVAIIGHHTDLVRALLNSVNESERLNYITMPNSKYGYNAFQMASELGRGEIVRCLLDTAHAVGGDDAKRVLVRSKLGDGLNAAQLAAVSALPTIMKDLLSAFENAEVADLINNERDFRGFTLVHLAASGGSLEIVELLISLGGRLDVTNNKGQTPLMVATENGHQSVIEFLNQKLSADFDMD